MEKTKILILGANGMLGHKLFLHLSEYVNFEVYATVRCLESLSQYFSPQFMKNVVSNVDAAVFDSMIKTIELIKPDFVINCIGIVKQGLLGQNIPANITVNALLPHKIAQVCQENSTRLLHISTDCVFSGNKGNYSETDVPDAGDLYGRSKLLGELNYPHCLTLRTSIIGHEIKPRHGLLEWFLAQKMIVQGYTQHIFSGFPTIELAKIIAGFIIPNKQISGVYHLSSDPISKYELLTLVAAQYGKQIKIEPYAGTFCNRSLDSNKFRNLTGFIPLSWPEMIARMHQDYLDSSYGNR